VAGIHPGLNALIKLQQVWTVDFKPESFLALDARNDFGFGKSVMQSGFSLVIK